MSDQEAVIRIAGLSKVDKFELNQLIGGDKISFKDETLGSGEYGELVTTTNNVDLILG